MSVVAAMHAVWMIVSWQMRLILLATLTAALTAQEHMDFAAGERAYREGRFADAQDLFAALEAAAGEAASSELLFDLALAALQNGELKLAESAVERAAASGGVVFASRREFLLGNVAWARGEKAAALAARVEAEPFAYRPALVHVEAARDHWLHAAVAAPDWPAARRNVERAMLRLLELERLRQAAEARRQQERGGGKANPKLVAQGDEGNEPEQDRRGSGTETEANELAPLEKRLSAAELTAMFERLDRKERQKRALRRAPPRAQRIAVERDW